MSAEKKKPSRKKDRMVSIRLEPELFDRAAAAAKARGVSLSEFIRSAALRAQNQCADCHAYGAHARLVYTVVQGTTVQQSPEPFGWTSGLEASFAGWLCKNCAMERYGMWVP